MLADKFPRPRGLSKRGPASDERAEPALRSLCDSVTDTQAAITIFRVVDTFEI